MPVVSFGDLIQNLPNLFTLKILSYSLRKEQACYNGQKIVGAHAERSKSKIVSSKKTCVFYRIYYPDKILS